MTLYLGVDIGTTRTKVGCVDGDTGQLVAVAAAPTPVHDDALGGTRDAGALIETVQGLLDEVLDHPEVQVGRLGGLAVGSVGEEVVLLDADGAVTGPVLAWHAEHGRRARRWVTDPALSPLDDTFSVFKLAWLARERPEELARAVTFTSLADHVALTLVGDGADGAFLNVSHSSRTGLLDLDSTSLRADRLAGVGAGHLRLPRLVPSGTIVGTWRRDGRPADGLPVVTGGHDHWCGAFGAGVRRAGDVYVSAGTSEAQVMLVDRLPADLPPDVDAGAFVSGDLLYLHRATPAGRIYQAWRELLYAGEEDDVLWDEVLPDHDVPAASVDVAGRTVELGPLPFEPTRGRLMTSLFAGLAQEAERTTARLEVLAGRPAADVVVAGLPASRPGWRGLRQDATARTLHFVTEPEATLVGVALLARAGVEGGVGTTTMTTTTGGTTA